ncbi:phage tail tape measure protein, partial [Aeromonas salmonicida]
VIADFTKFGSDLIDGLLKGISDKWDALKTKIKALSDLLPEWPWNNGSVTANITSSAGQPALAGGSGYAPRIAQTPVPKPVAAKGGNSTTHHQWTIVQQPGETPDDLVRKIDQRLDQRDRQAAARGRATLGDRN